MSFSLRTSSISVISGLLLATRGVRMSSYENGLFGLGRERLGGLLSEAILLKRFRASISLCRRSGSGQVRDQLVERLRAVTDQV